MRAWTENKNDDVLRLITNHNKAKVHYSRHGWWPIVISLVGLISCWSSVGKQWALGRSWTGTLSKQVSTITAQSGRKSSYILKHIVSDDEKLMVSYNWAICHLAHHYSILSVTQPNSTAWNCLSLLNIHIMLLNQQQFTKKAFCFQ